MDTKKIQEAVKMIIEAVGEDGSREGLARNTGTHCQDVPRRFLQVSIKLLEVHLSKIF